MRITLFSSKPYDRDSFALANQARGHRLHFLDARLDADTAALAAGSEVVCAFVNDDLGAGVLERLKAGGTRLIALRSAGYNHVDLSAAAALGLPVVRVPAYSPHAVAEHAVALVLALNRRIHRAFNRTREGDFSLHGLTGFDLHGKTVGVVGSGQIGATFARIMLGFGCQVLLHDPQPDAALSALGARYVDLDELLWSFAPPPRPRPAAMSDVAAVTPESTAMARELKRRGFRFVGPTTAYALMQATGMVDDHLATCWVRPAGTG